MSFVRPEIQQVFDRWRSAIIGAILVLIGLFFAATGTGIMPYVGGAVVLVGAALLWDGVRRARFPKSGGGLGVVELDERQISYFGPLGGGALSIEELTLIKIVTTDNGPFVTDVIWQFTDSGGQRLLIPSNAEGADRIFDALAALKGVNYDAVTRANGATDTGAFTIWQKSRPQLH